MTQGRVLETNAMEQCSLIVFQFTQVACTDFIYPQRPDGRPAVLIVSLRLPDGHQKAEHTTKSKGQIYLENKPLCEIDRKCSVMMQTVFGHPPNAPDRCVPPCVAKTCAVRPVFARVVGELGAVDPRLARRARTANEAPGSSLGAGPETRTVSTSLINPGGLP